MSEGHLALLHRRRNLEGTPWQTVFERPDRPGIPGKHDPELVLDRKVRPAAVDVALNHDNDWNCCTSRDRSKAIGELGRMNFVCDLDRGRASVKLDWMARFVSNRPFQNDGVLFREPVNLCHGRLDRA